MRRDTTRILTVLAILLPGPNAFCQGSKSTELSSELVEVEIARCDAKVSDYTGLDGKQVLGTTSRASAYVGYFPSDSDAPILQVRTELFATAHDRITGRKKSERQPQFPFILPLQPGQVLTPDQFFTGN